MKKLLYRRSVARPFVPRKKKQLGVPLSILFLWLSGADNRRCTVAGPMRRVDWCWDGWLDAAATAARDTFLLSPSASAVPPVLSGDIIKR